MKFLVLIKEIVNVDSVDIDSKQYLPKDFDQDDVIMNPNDKNAIEAALVLKEKYGGTVGVLCVGSEKALNALREAIAMGADEAARVDINDCGYLNPLAKSEIITKAIKKMGQYDIIFTGMNSVDYGQAQIPVLVATGLSLPHLTYATDISLEDDNKNVASNRYIEAGTVKVKISMPCIISVATTANKPRYTSVKRILLAKKTPIPVMSLNDLNVEVASLSAYGGLELLEVEHPKQRETETFKVEEEDLEKAVDMLLAKMKEDGFDLVSYKH